MHGERRSFLFIQLLYSRYHDDRAHERSERRQNLCVFLFLLPRPRQTQFEVGYKHIAVCKLTLERGSAERASEGDQTRDIGRAQADGISRAESESLHACGNGSLRQSRSHSGINTSSLSSGVDESISRTSPTGQQQHSSCVLTMRSITHIFSSRLTRSVSIRAAYPPARHSATAVNKAPVIRIRTLLQVIYSLNLAGGFAEHDEL